MCPGVQQNDEGSQVRSRSPASKLARFPENGTLESSAIPRNHVCNYHLFCSNSVPPTLCIIAPHAADWEGLGKMKGFVQVCIVGMKKSKPSGLVPFVGKASMHLAALIQDLVLTGKAVGSSDSL